MPGMYFKYKYSFVEILVYSHILVTQVRTTIPMCLFNFVDSRGSIWSIYKYLLQYKYILFQNIQVQILKNSIYKYD